MRNPKLNNEQLNHILDCGQKIECDKSLSFKNDLVKMFTVKYPTSTYSFNTLIAAFKRQSKKNVKTQSNKYLLFLLSFEIFNLIKRKNEFRLSQAHLPKTVQKKSCNVIKKKEVRSFLNK